MQYKNLIFALILILISSLLVAQNTDEIISDTINEIVIPAPNDYDGMFEIDGIKIFLYNSKSDKQFDINSKLAMDVENNLDNKFTDYIRKQKSGMIGIAIVGEKEIKNHLFKQKDLLLTTYNRRYYGLLNDNNERIVKIVFSNSGKSNEEIIEYNLDNENIEKFYNYLTY